MGFKPPPGIVQRVMRFKMMKIKDGKFLLWDVPCFIDPVYMQLYYYKLMSSASKEQDANLIRYQTGKFQACIGTKIVNQRFGFAKSIQDKKRLTLFNEGQANMLGLGKFESVKLDFDNEIFIYKSIVSPFADEYKRFFGLQKHGVDYWIAGMYAGYFEVVQNKEFVGIETRCVAKGDKCCEFIIKPVAKWDKKDPVVKKNLFLFEKTPHFKELGSRFEPYLGLK